MVDVEICEVGPRDGLQNEPEILPTAVKVELIGRLVAAGIPKIEVSSFVSPKWIPQLADAEDVVAALPEESRARRVALVPNFSGWERFERVARVDEAAVFISASETHNKKNVNRTIAEQVERIREVVEAARAAGVPVRAYVSTAFGCPDEGTIEPGAVLDLVDVFQEMGVSEIALGDTIGVALPRQVRELVLRAAERIPMESLVLHVHDTYGRALTNAMTAFDVGIRKFDSSLGGLGGCPYARGASGNLASEDLVDLLEGQGIRTGIDLDALIQTSSWLEDDVLQRPLPSRVLRAHRGRG